MDEPLLLRTPCGVNRCLRMFATRLEPERCRCSYALTSLERFTLPEPRTGPVEHMNRV